jgi:anti-anti-sigma factor
LNLPRHIIESTGAGAVKVAGVLDTYAAGALRDELARALREQGGLSVDMSDVESCDFSTIQLLCSARRSAGQAGKPFAVAALSDGVARTCAALGLSPHAFTGAGSE